MLVPLTLLQAPTHGRIVYPQMLRNFRQPIAVFPIHLPNCCRRAGG